VLVVLSGAKKNVGDFVITERAERILQHVTGHEIRRLPNWESLDHHLDVLRAADGIVVAGGPGYRPDLHGGVYPLTSDPGVLAELAVPVTFFGLGWKGDPGDDFDHHHYRFNMRTRQLIETLGGAGRYSARDDLSVTVLSKNNVPQPVMSGCPVWYDLETLNRWSDPPQAIKQVVFTPPQQEMFHDQSRRLLATLKDRYVDAHFIVAFQRGIAQDVHTSAAEARLLIDYERYARELGCEVRDVSYDTRHIDFYRDSDLHVGYRLHAHLVFLSYGRPSVILEEDGRARGAAESLDTPSVRAWRLTAAGKLARRFHSHPAESFARRAGAPIKAARVDVAADVMAIIESERAAGHPAVRRATGRIAATWPIMQDFARGVVRT
jgi:hypothetical protein